jgi:N-acetylglucosamine-6-sulfatase
LLASVILVGVFCSLTSCSHTPPTKTSPKPNFVFILVDDMRKGDLKYMPKTRSLLGSEKGMRFEKAYVSNALCCPSRATIMRGQYAHNAGVWGNHNGPNGGWKGYQNHGNERDNIATRLADAGYQTGLFGKYFNGYAGGTTHVPPGWDSWFALFGFRYNGYEANDNGNIRQFDPVRKYYVTDVLGEKTQRFIEASVDQKKPFFAYVAPIGPHKPAKPARRDERTFDGEKASRPPSFNEADVSDKPSWIRSLPRLSADQLARIDDRHEARAETLQAIDDLVEGVVEDLRAEGELNNTYVVFTSDNGWEEGEHRIPKEKTHPYEESSAVPLLIRGPDVRAGSTTNKLALNTDYLPTFTDLAGIQTPEYVDGRSLRPVLEGSATTWRSAILMERRNGSYPERSFYGISTSDGRKYVEYKGGFRELYDLATDPYELENSYDATAPPADLAARLKALKDCAGATCRSAEDGRSFTGRDGHAGTPPGEGGSSPTAERSLGG